MMTINEIQALVETDESRTLELKKSTGELKDERTVRKFRTVREVRRQVNSVVRSFRTTGTIG